MSSDYAQLAADIISGLPEGTSAADARRALNNIRAEDHTAALATMTGGGGGGGGGWAPERNVGQCSLEFNGFGLGPGETHFAPFSFLSGDESMVDLTAPTSPKPVDAGTYAYLLTMRQEVGGAAGSYTPLLTIDEDWYTLTLSNGAVNALALVVLSATWYSDALSPFRLSINSDDTDLYSGILYVQRVT